MHEDTYDPNFSRKYDEMIKMKTQSAEPQPYNLMKDSFYNKKSKISPNYRVENLLPQSFYIDKEGKEVYRPNSQKKKGIITTNSIMKHRINEKTLQPEQIYTHYNPDRKYNRMEGKSRGFVRQT